MSCLRDLMSYRMYLHTDRVHIRDETMPNGHLWKFSDLQPPQKTGTKNSKVTIISRKIYAFYCCRSVQFPLYLASTLRIDNETSGKNMSEYRKCWMPLTSSFWWAMNTLWKNVLVKRCVKSSKESAILSWRSRWSQTSLWWELLLRIFIRALKMAQLTTPKPKKLRRNEEEESFCHRNYVCLWGQFYLSPLRWYSKTKVLRVKWLFR